MHFGKTNFAYTGIKHGFLYQVFTFKGSMSVSVLLRRDEQGKFKVVPPHSTVKAFTTERYKHRLWKIAVVCSINSGKKYGTFF